MFLFRIEQGHDVTDNTLLDIAGTDEYVFRVDYFYELKGGYLLISLALIAVTKLLTSDLSSTQIHYMFTC